MHADASGMCQARCGVYVEGMGPVPVLSGVGLYVEDDDDYRDFLMTVRFCHPLHALYSYNYNIYIATVLISKQADCYVH